MVLRIVEDDEKIWALGIPINKAMEIAPELEWEEVFIKVVDPPLELSSKNINSRVSYIFSEIPITGGIQSSWCHKKMEEEDVEYVEVTADQLQQMLPKGKGISSGAMQELLGGDREGG